MARVVILRDIRSPFPMEEIDQAVNDIRAIVLRVTSTSVIEHCGRPKEPCKPLLDILREHNVEQYSSLSLISVGEGTELFHGASDHTLGVVLPELLADNNARLSHLSTGGRTLNIESIVKMDTNVDNADRVALYRLMERYPGVERKFVVKEVLGNVCRCLSSDVSQGMLGRTTWCLEQLEDTLSKLNLDPDTARAIRESVQVRRNTACGNAVVRVSTMRRRGGGDNDDTFNSSAYLSFNLYSPGTDFKRWEDTLLGERGDVELRAYIRHATNIRERARELLPCTILGEFLCKFPSNLGRRKNLTPKKRPLLSSSGDSIKRIKCGDSGFFFLPEGKELSAAATKAAEKSSKISRREWIDVLVELASKLEYDDDNDGGENGTERKRTRFSRHTTTNVICMLPVLVNRPIMGARNRATQEVCVALLRTDDAGVNCCPELKKCAVAVFAGRPKWWIETLLLQNQSAAEDTIRGLLTVPSLDAKERDWVCSQYQSKKCVNLLRVHPKGPIVFVKMLYGYCRPKGTVLLCTSCQEYKEVRYHFSDENNPHCRTCVTLMPSLDTPLARLVMEKMREFASLELVPDSSNLGRRRHRQLPREEMALAKKITAKYRDASILLLCTSCNNRYPTHSLEYLSPLPQERLCRFCSAIEILKKGFGALNTFVRTTPLLSQFDGILTDVVEMVFQNQWRYCSLGDTPIDRSEEVDRAVAMKAYIERIEEERNASVCKECGKCCGPPHVGCVDREETELGWVTRSRVFQVMGKRIVNTVISMQVSHRPYFPEEIKLILEGRFLTHQPAIDKFVELTKGVVETETFLSNKRCAICWEYTVSPYQIDNCREGVVCPNCLRLTIEERHNQKAKELGFEHGRVDGYIRMHRPDTIKCPVCNIEARVGTIL